MTIGTKSVLFGAHCFAIHPWFVALAWWKLYGFPFDPRLWVAFFVHDVGYFGMPNMDGEEGEWHPRTGAAMASWLFDFDATFPSRVAKLIGPPLERVFGRAPKGSGWYLGTWHNFCFYHSRFLAKKYGVSFSPLCVADKLSICLTPRWLYLPMVNLTGEIKEYMSLAKGAKYAGEPTNKYESMKLSTNSQREWFDAMCSYLRRWVEEHKDLRDDTWTPSTKQARDVNGVWK